MGSGYYLRNAIQKYGIENFNKEILEYFDSSELMYSREKEIVNEDFLKRKDVYNLTIGGKGSWYSVFSTGRHIYGKNGQIGYGGENLIHGKEELKKILIERGTWEERCQEISSTLKRKHESGEIISSFVTQNPMKIPEYKEKQKEKLIEIGHQKGEKNSQYGTMWITNIITGEHKKVKKEENIPENYVQGRLNLKRIEQENRNSEAKLLEKKTKQEEKIKLYREWHKLYIELGFDDFKKITNYKHTKQNLVQCFEKNLPEFIPQNGKKRNKSR